MFKAIVVAVGLIAGIWAGPALALDGRQAEVVVSLMEQLAEASGEPIYLGGSGEMLAYDEVGDGLIAAAGFDAAGWDSAYDAVIAGYMAGMPDEGFEAMFRAPLARLEASTTLSAEQKAAIRAELEPQIVEVRAAREAGRAHMAAVLPLAERVRVLLFSAMEQ
jgi:hypothetical protein